MLSDGKSATALIYICSARENSALACLTLSLPLSAQSHLKAFGCKSSINLDIEPTVPANPTPSDPTSQRLTPFAGTSPTL